MNEEDSQSLVYPFINPLTIVDSRRALSQRVVLMTFFRIQPELLLCLILYVVVCISLSPFLFAGK